MWAKKRRINMSSLKVVLTADVPSLGYAGDVVNVKGGYARNFLLPRNMCLVADPRNLKSLEHGKRVAEQQLKKIRKGAEDVAERLRQTAVTIARKVGEDEKLFGSVTSMDVEHALKAEGFDVDRRRIHIDKPLKSLGEFIVPVKVHKDVTADVQVKVVAE